MANFSGGVRLLIASLNGTISAGVRMLLLPSGMLSRGGCGVVFVVATSQFSVLTFCRKGLIGCRQTQLFEVSLSIGKPQAPPLVTKPSVAPNTSASACKWFRSRKLNFRSLA